MIDSSNLRAHAEACRKMALAASNQETRACLMALAKLWTSTAHDVEQNAKAAEMSMPNAMRRRRSTKPTDADRAFSARQV